MAEYYGNICTCRKCNGIVHTIRRGDTLYLLSRHYNVTINEIMRANSNINVYNLQIGDQICIPVRRPTPSQPSILGQLMNQNQGQMGRMPSVQPTEEERNQNMNMTNMGMSSSDMDEGTMSEGDTNLEYMETSAVETAADMPKEVEKCEKKSSEECCCEGSMKVRDLFKDEDMTLEQLAKMLKNI